jgi:hypothetical protein
MIATKAQNSLAGHFFGPEKCNIRYEGKKIPRTLASIGVTEAHRYIIAEKSD